MLRIASFVTELRPRSRARPPWTSCCCVPLKGELTMSRYWASALQDMTPPWMAERWRAVSTDQSISPAGSPHSQMNHKSGMGKYGSPIPLSPMAQRCLTQNSSSSPLLNERLPECVQPNEAILNSDANASAADEFSGQNQNATGATATVLAPRC